MLYKISEDLKLKKPPFLNEIQVQVQTQVKTSSGMIKKNTSNSQQHVLSPQAIAKAKMLAKTQSYTNTHFNAKFS